MDHIENCMHLHEYQAKSVLARRGLPVPDGRVAASPEEAGRAWDELHAPGAVVKAQVHAGARGKAGGIVPVGSRAEAVAAARRLLGSTLVTAQTGPRGRPVGKVLVEESLDIAAEFYLSVSLDRSRGCPVLLASTAGGVDVESTGRPPLQGWHGHSRPYAMTMVSASPPGGSLEHGHPNRGDDHATPATTEPDPGFSREYGDPTRGFEPFQARKVFARLGLGHELMKPMTAAMLTLGRALVDLDASLIELNPLALTRDGRLVAADVKMTLDDNALPRHPDLADLADPSQQDPREVEAARYDLSYVGLGGNIGCMVNGGGLALATLDLLRLHGGEPANFLDVGGTATAERVAAAFRILCRDERVRAVFVNIFGGIVQCDLIAEGILEAVRQVAVGIPIVVRLEGNRAAEGRRALAASGLHIFAVDSLTAAARKAVELAAL